MRSVLETFPAPLTFGFDRLSHEQPRKALCSNDDTDNVAHLQLIGGVYFGERQETDANGVAWDTTLYSVPEVERITRVACEIAMASSPPLPVHSIDKANVLATSRLWRKTVTDLVTKDYPEIQLDHQLVDSAAMVMVSNPRKLNGVILTENMFGDMCVVVRFVASNPAGS